VLLTPTFHDGYNAATVQKGDEDTFNRGKKISEQYRYKKDGAEEEGKFGGCLEKCLQGHMPNMSQQGVFG
jgi:hypothetical protein